MAERKTDQKSWISVKIACAVVRQGARGEGR